MPSSPLVPGNDPTLLFTNAGMVQFKEAFLGRDPRGLRRATSSQRCVRAGGKHNDLENVGYTARHHTFFEMLGNFSFGDYFKREAIAWGWEFLTEELGLPADKLWITVFEEDDEAEAIWLNDIGVNPARLSRIGAKDNFWAMGDTGPCGPCSEIFYDHGPDIPGGPPGTPEEDGDRYIEIWNLVFTQYDRAADGTLNPLPRPSVDTGMGLERVAAVLQGVHNNYDIDLFQGLIKAAAKETGCDDLENKSLRVIADHIRATAFLITDSVLPGNEGRGYVLRRIMRRAMRHAHKLGMAEPFFHKLVAPLVNEMGEAYPELAKSQAMVEKIILQEEQRFAETLDKGMAILEDCIAGLEDQRIPGETVFKLYDTYGFPVDLTADIARERDLELDMPGFEAAMGEQRDRARAASNFSAETVAGVEVEDSTDFTGYEQLQDEGQVIALFREGEAVDELTIGEHGIVVLDRSPFYAESGGQVGDRGRLTHAQMTFTVEDTQAQASGAHSHIGVVEQGSIRVNDRLRAEVDHKARGATVRNHSATHLLHAALKKVLGEHVQQKGSLVEPSRLRFDFSHHAPLTQDELAKIERLVNNEVLKNIETEVSLSSYDDAVAKGAVALFGEKYGDQVRVLRFGDFSCELCGGTHVSRTGDIGLFKVVSEGGIASGVRRIEAVTGSGALDWIQQTEKQIRSAAGALRAAPDELNDKLTQMLERNKSLEKELATLNSKMAAQAGGDLASEATDVAGIKLLTAKLDGSQSKTLRETLDKLKQKLGSAVILLAAVNGDKIAMIAGVTDDLTSQIKAGDLLNHVASQVGGKGGGRPDMAQGGGSQPENLDAALASVTTWVEEKLN